MTEETSLTSYWINFFIEAGVPPADSAQYAMVFSDNRINESMLLDLNKDYLNDIGITRLGDVILILKKAKAVHNKSLEEKLLKANSNLKPQTSGILSKTPVPSQNVSSQLKKDSPMTRIVGHCLGGVRSSSPANAEVDIEKSTTIVRKSKRAVSLPDEPIPSPLPAGRPEKRKSVFDRLDTSNIKTESDTSDVVSRSVFSRLGGKMPRLSRYSEVDAVVKLPATNCLVDKPLPYKGVLVPPKKGVESKFTVTLKNDVIIKKGSREPEVKRNEKNLPAISTEGIFGTGSQPVRSLRERLGKVVSPADTTQSGAKTTNITMAKSPSVISQNEVTSSDDSRVKRPDVFSRIGKIRQL